MNLEKFSHSAIALLAFFAGCISMVYLIVYLNAPYIIVSLDLNKVILILSGFVFFLTIVNLMFVPLLKINAVNDPASTYLLSAIITAIGLAFPLILSLFYQTDNLYIAAIPYYLYTLILMYVYYKEGFWDKFISNIKIRKSEFLKDEINDQSDNSG